MKRIFEFNKRNHNGRVYNKNSFYNIPSRIPIVSNSKIAINKKIRFTDILGFATIIQKDDGVYADVPNSIKSSVSTAGFGNIDNNGVIFGFVLTSLFLTNDLI